MTVANEQQQPTAATPLPAQSLKPAHFIPTERAHLNAQVVLDAGLCTADECQMAIELAGFLQIVDQQQQAFKFCTNSHVSMKQFRDTLNGHMEDKNIELQDQKKHFIEEYIDTENIYLLCLPHISSLFHQMLKSSAASDRNILREIDISQASHSMHQSSENSPDQSLQFVDELFKNQFEGNFEFLMGLGSKFIAKIKEARESLVSDPVKYKDMISLIDYSISNFQRNMADILRYKIQIKQECDLAKNEPAVPSVDDPTVTECLKYYHDAIATAESLFPYDANEALLSAQLNLSVFLYDVLHKKKEALDIVDDVIDKCKAAISKVMNDIHHTIMNNIYSLMTLIDSNRAKWSSSKADNL